MTIPSLPRDEVRPPTSAWVFGALCVAGQLLQLGLRGVNDSSPLLLAFSAGLCALVVTWFAAGVLRARGGRVVVVSLLLALVAFVDVVSLCFADDVHGRDVVEVAISVATLAALFAYGRTDYFRVQQAYGGRLRVSLGGLLLLAAIAGGLGGVIHDPASGSGSSVQVEL